ncbi:MAG: acetyl-CoA carboxylase biotin carboxyl carrier protein [Pseudomonadota bacterium]|nr:acetyl-CoA carboxylase biotin carboxyl carrier protein [Pseudomonadota bacterium]
MTNKDVGKSVDKSGDGKNKSFDAEAIRELAELLSETSLTEIEVEQAGLRIRVSRQGAVVHAPVPVMPALNHAPTAHAEAPAAKREGHAPGTVTSPMVGTVYVAPEPGAAPFVKVGDVVKEGDTLLIVEAMKTMNPIAAPRGGTITEICIHDTEPVEFGQALMVIG